MARSGGVAQGAFWTPEWTRRSHSWTMPPVMKTSGFREATGRARITLSKTRAAYIGPGLDLTPHRNVAVTVALALHSPFELEFLGGGAGDVVLGHVALIPSGALHHLRASGDMMFLYLDALSDDHKQLKTSDLASAHARLLREHGDAVWTQDVDQLCELLGVPAHRVGDARIAEVVRRIDEAPQAFVRVADAAGLAGVSASHFQSLFRRSVGVPFRRYRLWRRMAAVMRALSNGETLTGAALEAGFSGSAHLSATFRTMFGLTPSTLIALGARIEVAQTERRN